MTKYLIQEEEEVSWRIELFFIITSNSLSEEFSIKYNTQASSIFKFSSIIYHYIALTCKSAMQLIILVIVKFLQN